MDIWFSKKRDGHPGKRLISGEAFPAAWEMSRVSGLGSSTCAMVLLGYMCVVLRERGSMSTSDWDLHWGKCLLPFAYFCEN